MGLLDIVWRMIPWRLRGGSGCDHMREERSVEPSADGCEECLKIGGQWVHLRMCLVCGKVGCCDNSPNTHATAHFQETGHPVMRSVEPDESWVWCYPDQMITRETTPG